MFTFTKLFLAYNLLLGIGNVFCGTKPQYSLYIGILPSRNILIGDLMEVQMGLK